MSPSSPLITPDEPFKRSAVNRAVSTAREVLDRLNVRLPSYAYWDPASWQNAGAEMAEVRDVMLGWDVTDFGSGRFREIGRVLYTLRNGKSGDPRYLKSYAEKLLIEPEGQRSPMHYHRSKREDIINRGGGNVIVVLHSIGAGGFPGNEPISVQVDGVCRELSAGAPIRLCPGESLSIPPCTFHQFWAEEGSGISVDGERYTLSAEVSSICDDWEDNVFIDPWACRFPSITEDEPRDCYLCHEYPTFPAG